MSLGHRSRGLWQDVVGGVVCCLASSIWDILQEVVDYRLA